jgi:cytoskeletal protein CcmA (bactofilin family)
MTRRTAVSVLSAGLDLEGDVTSDGDIWVLGRFMGNLTAHKLILGRHGTIDGWIEAESVVIDGTFSGSLLSKSVLLGHSALVKADIAYDSMEIQPGAVYSGRAARIRHKEAAAVAEVTEFSPPKRARAGGARMMRGT